MSRVLGRESFPQKNMPQVPAAVAAHDLCAISVCVEMSFYGPFDLIVETGPAAVAAELVRSLVQRRIALTADVCARILQIGVLSYTGPLGALLQNHIRFNVIERIVLCRSVFRGI